MPKENTQNKKPTVKKSTKTSRSSTSRQSATKTTSRSTTSRRSPGRPKSSGATKAAQRPGAAQSSTARQSAAAKKPESSRGMAKDSSVQSQSRNENTAKKHLDTVVETAFNPFGQAYYLVMILVIVQFMFSLYLFYKVEGMSPSGQAVARGGTADNGAPQVADANGASVPAPSTNEPWRGDQNARFVIIEYSDFECSFCKRAHADVVRLEEENDNVAWVYRDFPLGFHQNAQTFAEAAHCAGAQGAGGFFGQAVNNDNYWAMADAIYEDMPGLTPEGLPALAAELGLNQEEFESCLDSGEFAETVSGNLAAGEAAGVQATPTFFFYDTQTGDTEKVEGALPYEQLKATLDGLIERNN